MSEERQSEGGRAHLAALRHDFQPNPAMVHGLEGLFTSGIAPHFSLYSTREAYIDMDYYLLGSYLSIDADVQEDIEKWKKASFTMASVALRQLPDISSGMFPAPLSDKLRVSFMPSDSVSFSKLISKLDSYPDMYPRTEPPRHYLYADFSMKQVVDSYEEVEQNIRALVRKGLFAASVKGISYTPKTVPQSRLRSGWRDRRY